MCTAESEASPVPSGGRAWPSERERLQEVHPLEAAGEPPGAAGVKEARPERVARGSSSCIERETFHGPRANPYPAPCPGNSEALAALLAREPALLLPHGWLAGHASVSPAQRAELAAWQRAAGAALGCSLAMVEHAAALLDRFLAAQHSQVRRGGAGLRGAQRGCRGSDSSWQPARRWSQQARRSELPPALPPSPRLAASGWCSWLR